MSASAIVRRIEAYLGWHDRTCVQCAAAFADHRPQARYCSVDCAHTAHDAREQARKRRARVMARYHALPLGEGVDHA